MDQPGPPLCRVRLIFDLEIPYDLSADKSLVFDFIHSLWKIYLGLEKTMKDMDSICDKIQEQRQEPLAQLSNGSPNCSIQIYHSYPSP